MSKSMNMLRTRRRDNNVKPNRRLDRKSSRGMIYENEELRLKTININAEIERGQSDIKKLKRENEMLKKEIWCLRDEYEKLDKLLKDKEISFSSSTTCSTSETESCSSCSEDSDQVETSQNLENVQKTNLKNLHVEFDHLSVVPEENSTENSDKTSTRTSIPNDGAYTEKHIIKPDQSYPSFEALSKASTLPVQDKLSPKHFFAPIKTSKSCEDCLNNQHLGSSSTQTLYETQSQYYLPKINEYDAHNYGGAYSRKNQPIYENFPKNPSLNVVSPLSKSNTDLIVKMDNQNFNTMTSSSFSNGGNLEELLNDIESISHDILKLSNPNLQFNADQQHFGQNSEECIGRTPEIPSHSGDYQNAIIEATQSNKPYKSELNVVLMPTPMPLLGFDKYRNIQVSSDSIQSRSLENVTGSPNVRPHTPEIFYSPDGLPYHATASTPTLMRNENPFFFGNFKDSGASDYFNSRYNPDNYMNKELNDLKVEKNKRPEIYNSKTNLLEINSEQVSSENEENLKFKTSKSDREDECKSSKNDKSKSDKKMDVKSPKLSIRRKVSIHFKGKKDKSLKNKSLDNLDQKTPVADKKHSLFDIKFTTETKQKSDHQKTPSIDSKKSNLDSSIEPKTPTSGDSKSDKRNSTIEPKTPCSDCKNAEKPFDGKVERLSSYEIKLSDPKNQEKKIRKSSSLSPDRKHVHVREDSKKSHKKHKKSDKILRNRRSTLSNERYNRERSFSVCTDRSNMLGFGFSSGFSVYDDGANSDRERTNSMSSCGTVKMRKMSNISNFPVTGKIPWCACWGNGCL